MPHLSLHRVDLFVGDLCPLKIRDTCIAKSWLMTRVNYIPLRGVHVKKTPARFVVGVVRCVNGYVRPHIFGEQDLVRMGGPASAVAVSTQEIFFEDRR